MREPDLASVRYFVLGPLRVRKSDGSVAEIAQNKRRTLLVQLLLRRNGWVETRDLVEALWGVAQPKSASVNTKGYVLKLRQMLDREGEDSPIESRPGAYRLAVAEGELDIDVFEELVSGGKSALRAGDAARAEALLREALALWRGASEPEFVEAVVGTGSPQLRELRRGARVGLAESRIAVGRPDEAVPALKELVEEYPIDEPTWVLLVTALLRGGRRAEAISAHDEARRNIDYAVGGSPGGELRAVFRELTAEPEVPAPEQPVPEQPAPEDPPRPDAPDSDAVPSVVEADIGRAEPEAEPERVAAVRENGSRRFRSRLRNRWVLATSLLACSLLVIGAAVAGPVLFGAEDDPAAEVPAELRLGATAPKRGVPDAATVPGEPPRLRFGLGSKAPTAAQQRLAVQAPIGMYTTWYDGPEELPKYQSWSRDLIPGYYADGKAMHLIVNPGFWKPKPVDTAHGPACGMKYPLSDDFLDDMRELATAFAGAPDGPPLYVSVFDGPQKAACGEHDSGYNSDPWTRNYFDALKDRYRDVRQVFHRYAPNARVGLNWSGWQASHDDPELGEGLSLMRYFSDVLAISDFQSFDAYEKEDNSRDVERMVGELGQYGPVMVSNFGPYQDEATGALTRNDLSHVFAPEKIASLVERGLFAWSFREEHYVEVTPEVYELSRDIVRRYGR